ncbi:mediator of RNA polymerase II transcription subunit 12-like protein [Lingula anatina]|uniref:Mediator of RNA polymerase II transcription subunit 12-like protein n=1 Tax=Lingula anatina TaxID=7574 RepID=A0A1S3JEX8_LINAN|nr:mediator of RNA polymerase II transcription subunit 12-like protein [Lingula anatina]|eukprot:XP_013408893.1 mediator of RNA polymerase II transcription subunit 12-like protein [Lingula anatina]
MAAFPSQDNRSLKKPRLGPPDVYPQEHRQKEDELTHVSVKQGFNNIPHFNDEYGSAKHVTVMQMQNAIGSSLSAIIAKKTDLNTLQDTGKKKPIINTKDNFWPVTARSKQAIENWFKDLAGSKPLTQIGRKVPVFNKREEIFTTLCEYNVPLIRAAWFLKMNNAYTVAMNESKTKSKKQNIDPSSGKKQNIDPSSGKKQNIDPSSGKKQNIDPSSDWTITIYRFLKEHLSKIIEHYHGGSSGPQTSFLTATQTSHVDIDLALKQWQYTTRLARHMYEEGLLDRHEFLIWLVDTVDKLKSPDDNVLKLLLMQVLQYVDEITCAQSISRKLAHFCCKKLALMCNETGYSTPRSQSPLVTANANGQLTTTSAPQPNPVLGAFGEYTSCSQHRGLLLGLSAVLQTIVLKCPSAVVWNNLGEGKSASVLCGSPLDLLPCAPSSLPMPPGPNNAELRALIRSAEHQIKLRGQAAEVRWSSDKCQQSTIGFTISRILGALESLDRQNFERVEQTASLDTLYNKIFAAGQSKDQEPVSTDEATVNLLCEWAVSVKRSGCHRAIVVAKLLERRQNELTSELQESEILDEKDSLGSEAMAPSGLPIFQNLLIQYLDHRAPVLDESPSAENRTAFSNLISLFCELIRHDVFSHDAYMCTLISRGDLEASPPMHTAPGDSLGELASVKSENPSVKPEAAQEEQKMDVDTDTFDPDYDIFAFRDDPKSPDMNVDHSTQMLWELQEHLGKISPVGGAIGIRIGLVLSANFELVTSCCLGYLECLGIESIKVISLHSSWLRQQDVICTFSFKLTTMHG